MNRYLFWTGGWDSTYRLVELSRMELDVFPVYVKDHTRSSMDIELETMRKLHDALSKDARTKAVLHPIMVVDESDIKPSEEITKAYQKLSSEIRLGSQYEYLARMAAEYPGIEIGIVLEPGEVGGCMCAIQKYGKMITENGNNIVDKSSSSETVNLVFGNLSYPLIYTTEVEMLKNIREWGYEDFMKGIHFCYHPRHGKPCGICRPCQQKMDCNMEILIPKSAQKRFHLFRWAEKLPTLPKKIIRNLLLKL